MNGYFAFTVCVMTAFVSLVIDKAMDKGYNCSVKCGNYSVEFQQST